MRSGIGLLYIALTFAALLTPCGTIGADASLERFEFHEEKMGVPVSVTLYAKDAREAESAAEAVWRRFDELNATLSDWDPESEIIQLCRRIDETGERTQPSADLRRALEESRLYCELTGGAFDPTVSSVVKLWRRSRYFHERPPEKALDQAKKRIGLNVWNINADGVKTERGVRFDVGGIAKGIALDDALAVLRARGITSALINASGDLRIGDPPPGRAGWRVGVASLGEEPAFYGDFSNVGIASSGDANRYVEIDGARYSHIIDARTGEPLTRRCVAAVLAPTATTADALASALCVLGGEEFLKAVEAVKREIPGVSERFEYALLQVVDASSEPPYEESEIATYASPGFARMLNASREVEKESEVGETTESE